MIIGVDASNIRTGGGKKHLEKFISNSLCEDKNIKYVIVSNDYINSSFKELSNVKCISNRLLNLNNITSFISQFFLSKQYFKKFKCEIVFVPGGIFLSSFTPFVSMSQNMLPFDLKELKAFSISKRIKFLLIRIFQIWTFQKSDGIIFLTEFAKDTILPIIKKRKKYSIIPHGISQLSKNKYSFNKGKCKILYVSDFLPYKHQINVMNSVKELIQDGYDISLKLIGNISKGDLKKVYNSIPKEFISKDRIEILGFLPNKAIKDYYQNSSMLLFASTCENLPFIILEAISHGLPVITSDKKPMNQMVSGTDIFFDSYNIQSIKKIILKNMDSNKLNEMSKQNFLLSKNYSWDKNVSKTVNFLKSCI
jgi:glycosyltransferase involved in cell wall biosynthesis